MKFCLAGSSFLELSENTSHNTVFNMTQTKIRLSEDSIDDVLYFARAGETDDLVETLKELKAQHEGASEEDLLLAAVDEESGNTALHMSAANGHTGTTFGDTLGWETC